MIKLYLSIDIGASSGRHIVGWLEGGAIQTKEVYRFPNGVAEQDGRLTWDVVELMFHVKHGIDKALEQFPDIASFSIDHTRLQPGMYLSRRDGTVVTLDLRFRRPNTDDLLSNSALHSLEHIVATILRNSPEKDAVVYFGPMGCQTGFYVLFDEAKLPLSGIVELLKRAFNEAAAWDREMPGQSPYECGNYRNLDVAVCRKECAYYAQVIQDWTVDKLEYEFRL